MKAVRWEEIEKELGRMEIAEIGKRWERKQEFCLRPEEENDEEDKLKKNVDDEQLE